MSYRTRIRKLTKLLAAQSGPAAIALSSAPLRSSTRDQHYPFVQDGDFFYLTGSNHQAAILLLSSTARRPLLLTRKLTKLELLWEGAQPDLADLAHALGADHECCSDPVATAKEFLKGHHLFFHQSVPGSSSMALAEYYFRQAAYEKRNSPMLLGHAELLMAQLRLYKERSEVKLIKDAIKLTQRGLEGVTPLLTDGTTELEVCQQLSLEFLKGGGSNAFDSIVASGPAAAVLHYHRHDGHLRKGTPLLIDCGAKINGYCGDITRVFPVGGTFKGVYKDLYDIVDAAKKAAISKVRHGVKVQAVYSAAARVLTAGLKDLKVVRGDQATLMREEAFKPFFPHGIGHSLGIDVHDSGELRANTAATLEQGMVITIEPGLYFAKKTGKIPACGFRLEDDIVVTASGSDNLSEDIPCERAEVESLFSAS